MKTMKIFYVGMTLVLSILLYIGCDGSDSSSAENDSGSQTEMTTGVETDNISVSDSESATNDDSDFETESESGSGETPSAIYNVTLEQAKVPTVAVVEWSSNLTTIDNAYIEYGLDTSYGRIVDVSLEEPRFRTLVLGLKANGKIYHMRIVVVSGNDTFMSEDMTFETGYTPTVLPTVEVTYNEPYKGQVDFGYMVNGTQSNPNYIFILDSEGDYVWWQESNMGAVSGDQAGASDVALDWSGKYLYTLYANPSFQNGQIRRMSLDGEEVVIYDSLSPYDFHRVHHSLSAVPEGGVVFIEANEETGCDVVKHLAVDGSVTQVFDPLDKIAFPSDAVAYQCHANYIDYIASMDAFAFSVRTFDTVILIKRSGEVIWSIGRDDYQSVPTIPDWNIGEAANNDIYSQHGVQVWNQGKNMLLFNNSAIKGNTARIIEYNFDEGMTEAHEVWSYSREYANSTYYGNALRLTSGNTVVTYSIEGVINQMNDDIVLQKIKLSGPIGYTAWHESLYEPPSSP